MEYYLVHHGILGQKWGVRRYQNFDGTYTQAGLKRYAASREKYEKSRDEYRRIKKSEDKSGLAQAKMQMKADRRRMNKEYKHLKQDKLGDQGKELYKSGHTITEGHQNIAIGIIATSLAAKVTEIAIANSSLKNAIFIPNGTHMALPLSEVAGASVALGGTIITTGMRINQASRDKKLRAYYGHSSTRY